VNFSTDRPFLDCASPLALFRPCRKRQGTAAVQDAGAPNLGPWVQCPLCSRGLSHPMNHPVGAGERRLTSSPQKVRACPRTIGLNKLPRTAAPAFWTAVTSEAKSPLWFRWCGGLGLSPATPLLVEIESGDCADFVAAVQNLAEFSRCRQFVDIMPRRCDARILLFDPAVHVPDASLIGGVGLALP
jgi:hypothetical protein